MLNEPPHELLMLLDEDKHGISRSRKVSMTTSDVTNISISGRIKDVNFPDSTDWTNTTVFSSL